MVRWAVRVEIDSNIPAPAMRVGRQLMAKLRLTPGLYPVRFGTRRVRAHVDAGARLAAERVVVSSAVAKDLCLPGALRTSIQRHGEGGIAFGPLIGILVAPRVLERLRRQGLQPPHVDYARRARELGAVLCWFTPRDVNPSLSVIAGHTAEAGSGGRWRLIPSRFPVPRVVLRRIPSHEGPESDSFTARAPRLGCTVLRMGPIPQLEGLRTWAADPGLAPLIPWTRRLEPESLGAALREFADFFVKPDLPSVGLDLYRLARQEQGWRLIRWAPEGCAEQWLPDDKAVQEALAPLAGGPGAHLVQEALPLATYLGNPFDLSAVVQKDGRQGWDLSALLARVAAPGQEITSPGAVGWVAPGEAALRHAFPCRWPQLGSEIRRVALAAARAVDAKWGRRFELAVQLAVLRNGTLRLLHVDGEPDVELAARIHDPYAVQRLPRCPVDCAAGVDLG